MVLLSPPNILHVLSHDWWWNPARYVQILLRKIENCTIRYDVISYNLISMELYLVNRPVFEI
jgi:hypothetical protein